ncbi:MspA family porin [Rhodococcus xishaensis]|uniref:MspA protein n=1 Tax=Rhodococcus xishaensis TaxID=2487364 RepID=A0A3S3A642_9NOCA|nr:MspA family porin [Rhodococcus xishaensis]RVW02939.1 hypothetical protein EGT50_09470 [Rhodococcus xishaensis]
MHVNHRSSLRRRLARSGTAVIAGAAAVMLTVSVGSAGAAITYQPDSFAQLTTIDGWELNLLQTGQSINSVPPLSGVPTSRDMFATQRALATVGGEGRVPYTGGVLEVGYQIGYQVDFAGAILEAGAGVTPAAAVEVGSLGFDILDPLLGLGEAAVEFAIETPIEGAIVVEVLPGEIATVAVQRKECAYTQCAITLRDIHLDLDGALGLVSVRSYALFTSTTDISDDVLMSYGPAIVV